MRIHDDRSSTDKLPVHFGSIRKVQQPTPGVPRLIRSGVDGGLSLADVGECRMPMGSIESSARLWVRLDRLAG